MREVNSIFENANEWFLKEEINLVFSGVSERTLCGTLARYLHDEIKESNFNKYYVDVEYNRNQGEIKTIINRGEKVLKINCDIIVHSRGENTRQDNLIAIEMKKTNAKKDDKNMDRERLIALTKASFDDVWSHDGKALPKHVCGYILGVYYEINIRRRLINIEYYANGGIFAQYTIHI